MKGFIAWCLCSLLVVVGIIDVVTASDDLAPDGCNSMNYAKPVHCSITFSMPVSAPVLAVAGVKPDGTNAAIHLDRDGYVRLGDEDIKRIVKALRADEAKDENMRLFDDTCLALMEEAMRMLDGFMFRHVGLTPTDKERIKQQWSETKRECWAKP